MPAPIQTFVGGVEVTDIVQGGTSTHRLNKLDDAVFSIPVADAVNAEGKRGMIVCNDLPNPVDIHGFITQDSADDGEDGDGLIQYTIQAPREMWQWRPARNGPSTSDPGNYIKPTFFQEIGNLPLIAQELLLQSEEDYAPGDVGGDGALFIYVGGAAGGGPDLTDPGPTDWPMSIEEVMALMISTGQLDVVPTYATDPVHMATYDFYNGNYGIDLSPTVRFKYATGNDNSKRMRRTRDMTQVVNKLRYLLAPKIDDYRYKRSIETTNTDFPHLEEVLDVIVSRIVYGVRADIQIHDSFGVEADFVPLYWALWNDEAIFRAFSKFLYHTTPEDGIVPEFDVGDIIGVDAGAAFLGGFSGKQRVYERAISWTTEGGMSIAEIQSSEIGV